MTMLASMRVMHRMNIDGTMTFEESIQLRSSIQPSTMVMERSEIGATSITPALTASWTELQRYLCLQSLQHALGWKPSILTGEAENIIDFVDVNATHWFIKLVNGGDSDLPPCGQIDPSDPDSPVRCEIVPEMDTGTS